jgi:hypothetical protein
MKSGPVSIAKALSLVEESFPVLDWVLRGSAHVVVGIEVGIAVVVDAGFDVVAGIGADAAADAAADIVAVIVGVFVAVQVCHLEHDARFETPGDCSVAKQVWLVVHND